MAKVRDREGVEGGLRGQRRVQVGEKTPNGVSNAEKTLAPGRFRSALGKDLAARDRNIELRHPGWCHCHGLDETDSSPRAAAASSTPHSHTMDTCLLDNWRAWQFSVAPFHLDRPGQHDASHQSMSSRRNQEAAKSYRHSEEVPLHPQA